MIQDWSCHGLSTTFLGTKIVPSPNLCKEVRSPVELYRCFQNGLGEWEFTKPAEHDVVHLVS